MKLWLADTTSSPLRFSLFFLVRSVLRGEGRLVFCYGVLGKILKVPLVSLCPSPSLCFPCFVCALPLLAPVFFSVFVSWVHPCSKSLSISLCLTLPCICSFFFLLCEFVLWRRGWICGTLAFSYSLLFFFFRLSLCSTSVLPFFFPCSWHFFCLPLCLFAFFVFSSFIATEFHHYQVINRQLLQE